MNKLFLAAALTAALTMPAFAKTAKDQPPAVSRAAMPASTKTFVKKAGMTNLFEIQAGRIAEQKSDNSKVQDYAKMIIGDHQKAQEELKSAAKEVHGVSLPQSLDKKHRGLIKRLQSASGTEFLRTFKDQQVRAIRRASNYPRLRSGRPERQAQAIRAAGLAGTQEAFATRGKSADYDECADRRERHQYEVVLQGDGAEQTGYGPWVEHLATGQPSARPVPALGVLTARTLWRNRRRPIHVLYGLGPR